VVTAAAQDILFELAAGSWIDFHTVLALDHVLVLSAFGDTGDLFLAASWDILVVSYMSFDAVRDAAQGIQQIDSVVAAHRTEVVGH
jgi:hypothetical protein